MANRRNRFGRNVGNVSGRSAARNSRLRTGNRQRATGHGMSRRRFVGGVAAGVAGAAIGASGLVHATPGTIYVPDNYSTIQAAVNAAASGDTIIVRYGVYNGAVLISNKSLTIQGEAVGNRPVIVGSVKIEKNTIPVTINLEHLYITSFYAVRVKDHNANVHINDCRLEGFRSGLFILGGQIPGSATSANTTLTNSTLVGNFGALSVFGWNGKISGHLYAENNTFVSQGFLPLGPFLSVSIPIYIGPYKPSDPGSFSGEFLNNKIRVKASAPVGPEISIALLCGSTHINAVAENITFDGLEITADNDISGVAAFQAVNSVFKNMYLNGPINAGTGLGLGDFTVPCTTNNCTFTGIDFRNLTATLAQVYMDSGVHSNEFKNNVYGSVGRNAMAGIWCLGNDNDFVTNDYTKSHLLGWDKSPNQVPCILLDEGTSGNLVDEYMFPPGTTVCNQVLDLTDDLYIPGYTGTNDIPTLNDCTYPSNIHPYLEQMIEAIREKHRRHMEELEERLEKELPDFPHELL